MVTEKHREWRGIFYLQNTPEIREQGNSGQFMFVVRPDPVISTETMTHWADSSHRIITTPGCLPGGTEVFVV